MQVPLIIKFLIIEQANMKNNHTFSNNKITMILFKYNIVLELNIIDKLKFRNCNKLLL